MSSLGLLCPLAESCPQYNKIAECLSLFRSNMPAPEKYTKCSLYKQENLKAQTTDAEQLTLQHAQEITVSTPLKESSEQRPQTIRFLNEAEKRKYEVNEKMRQEREQKAEEWRNKKMQSPELSLTDKLKKALGRKEETSQ